MIFSFFSIIILYAAQKSHLCKSIISIGREAWWSHLVTTGKGLHHLTLVLALKSSTITEAFAMGVCSSTEQGIVKPENDFNSDELKKEHLEDKVVGEKPDSNIAATSDK